MDEVEVLVGAEPVPLSHVGLEIQARLHHTVEARHREDPCQDAKSIHIYQELEGTRGLFRGTGLGRGRQQSHFLAHLLRLLQAAFVTLAATVQELDPHQGQIDHVDRLADLYHHLGGLSEGGGDRFLVVIDHDPTPTLNTLAHVRPEDVDGPLRRHHRAFLRLLSRDIDIGSERLPLIQGQGLPLGAVMAGEVGGAEDRKDRPHSTRRMVKELHGLIFPRTIQCQTAVG